MSTTAHPWITDLRTRLDALEAALLSGDANEVEAASAQVQANLQGAPKTADFGQAGTQLRADMLEQAQRFGQLRQAVMRAVAQSDQTDHLRSSQGRVQTQRTGPGLPECLTLPADLRAAGRRPAADAMGYPMTLWPSATAQASAESIT